MRLDRPVGTLLLLWPTLAALWLAADGTPPLTFILVFSLGTVLMRSAGCVINDYADRRLDAHVARTAQRPLATGHISGTAALILFAVLVLLAASLLVYLNPLTRMLALAGLGIAALYPFMKRWTYLPQTVLGAAFSWGLVMAYTAVRDSLPQEAWLLFIASMVVLVLALKMDPFLAGLLSALPRLLDALTDPIMGYISDNTKSRWGRRKPYIFIGSIITGLTFMGMWQLHPEVDQRPRDILIDKQLPGTFTNTNLDGWLKSLGADTVSVAGYMTQMCCDTTARQAFHQGYSVEFLRDATGTLDVTNEAGSVTAEQLQESILVSC